MMNGRTRATAFLAALIAGWVATVEAAEIHAVMGTIAARLEQKQIKEGLHVGAWGDAWGFNGSLVAGMLEAYKCLDCATYKASAVLGGKFILWEARGDTFMGDELYALQRLSLFDDGPDHDRWQTVVHRFFEEDVGHLPQDVSRYTDVVFLNQMDSSTAVYYLAHLAVAANNAGVEGAAHWRQAVIDYLARVGDGQASFPVMALGAATWALARTGELDETPVGPYERNPYWKGVRLCDLPALLAGHQVPEGEEYAGSFYWRFDHTFGPFPGPLSGYTEDTIYGTMGLVAAASLQENRENCEMEKAIRAATATLLDGVDEDGKVYEHLAQEGRTYFAFGGEMLQVLCDVQGYLDSRPTSESEEGECGCACAGEPVP